jgi:hypothetical protein
MRLFLVATLLLLTSCATAPAVPSLPQVVSIDRAVSLSEVKGVALNVYLADGWALEKESEHMLTFIAENANVTARVLLGSQYDTRLFYRENLVLAPSATGVTLRTSQVLVSNHGSAFERVTPVEGGGGQRLIQIKSALTGENLASPDAQSSAIKLSAFTAGTATLEALTLTSGYSAAVQEGLSLAEWKKLHDGQSWEALALSVLKANSGSDLSWFYLGRSAEGLGFRDAARIYYQKSIEASKKKLISACLNCSGFNFPEDSQDRLIAMGSP